MACMRQAYEDQELLCSKAQRAKIDARALGTDRVGQTYAKTLAGLGCAPG